MILAEVGDLLASRGFGVRGVETEYTFQYQNKPARLEHLDIKYGYDKYRFVIDNEEMEDLSTIISDDGKLITISRNSYTIKDSK